MTDTTANDPYRVSAVLDDGGIYTGTMMNEQDARRRYDFFCSHSDRPPAFAALFVRKSEDGLFHMCRYFSGGSETVVEHTPVSG